MQEEHFISYIKVAENIQSSAKLIELGKFTGDIYFFATCPGKQTLKLDLIDFVTESLYFLLLTR